jgi:hypothetical protein
MDLFEDFIWYTCMIKAEKRLYTMKAGVYLIWSCARRFSIMEVIMAAA